LLCKPDCYSDVSAFSLILTITEDLIITSELINQIQANYKASLKHKLKTLQALWQESDKNHVELLAFLHQLAGSAGMYGYDQISMHCVQLQSALKDSNSLEDLRKEYDQLIEHIEQSINCESPGYRN
jgi:HPt (histidine-containing phosphotransfer) domain-containing protein